MTTMTTLNTFDFSKVQQIPCEVNTIEFTLNHCSPLDLTLDFVAIAHKSLDEEQTTELIHKFTHHYPDIVFNEKIVVMPKETFEALFKPLFARISALNDSLEELAIAVQVLRAPVVNYCSNPQEEQIKEEGGEEHE